MGNWQIAADTFITVIKAHGQNVPQGIRDDH